MAFTFSASISLTSEQVSSDSFNLKARDCSEPETGPGPGAGSAVDLDTKTIHRRMASVQPRFCSAQRHLLAGVTNEHPNSLLHELSCIFWRHSDVFWNTWSRLAFVRLSVTWREVKLT